MWIRQIAVAVALLAGSCVSQEVLPTLKLKGSVANILFVGDWGRTNAAKSIISQAEGGFRNISDSPTCTSANFAQSEEERVRGAEQQSHVANSMETVCKLVGCSSIMNTGDNFYECGLDNPARWKLDFEDIYQTSATPTIRKLKWYNSIGNHDIVASSSVGAQMSYGKKNPRWVFPSRYYGFSMSLPKNGLNIQVSVINTNPMVTKYNKNGTKYHTQEFIDTATPAALSAQLDWLEARLQSSTADYEIVIGHHPLVGAAGTVYGNKTVMNATGSMIDGGSIDEGMKDASGNPSFARLFNMIRKHKVSLYINGHDHANSYAEDPVNSTVWPTKYITTGAGSLPDVEDSCGVARSFIKYTNADTVVGPCGSAKGHSHPGMVTMSMSGTGAKVHFWNLPSDYVNTGPALSFEADLPRRMSPPSMPMYL